MKTIKILLTLVLCFTILVSCKIDDDIKQHGGILADRDIVSSILKELEDKKNSSLAEDGDVFWSLSGTIWHKSADCSYLSNSKEVYHGSIEDAKLEGKVRECTRCFSTEEDKSYAELEGNPIESHHVFFTKESNVWHENINCLELLGVEKIYNASIDKAKELGKESACDKCEK